MPFILPPSTTGLFYLQQSAKLSARRTDAADARTQAEFSTTQTVSLSEAGKRLARSDIAPKTGLAAPTVDEPVVPTAAGTVAPTLAALPQSVAPVAATSITDTRIENRPESTRETEPSLRPVAAEKSPTAIERRRDNPETTRNEDRQQAEALQQAERQARPSANRTAQEAAVAAYLKVLGG